jgi:hypothetical protein
MTVASAMPETRVFPSAEKASDATVAFGSSAGTPRPAAISQIRIVASPAFPAEGLKAAARNRPAGETARAAAS